MVFDGHSNAKCTRLSKLQRPNQSHHQAKQLLFANKVADKRNIASATREMERPNQCQQLVHKNTSFLTSLIVADWAQTLATIPKPEATKDRPVPVKLHNR